MTDTAQLEYNKTELLAQVLRQIWDGSNYTPLLKGVARDSQGNLDFGGKRLIGVGIPTGDTDIMNLAAMSEAENMAFPILENIGNGCTAMKHGVRVASTTNIPLTGSKVGGGITIDGVLITEDSVDFDRNFMYRHPDLSDRLIMALTATPYALNAPAFTGSGIDVPVSAQFPHGKMSDYSIGCHTNKILLKNQTNPAENGIYYVKFTSTTYTLESADDDNTLQLLGPGSVIPVQEGTVNKNTMWMVVQSDWTAPVNALGIPATPVAIQMVKTGFTQVEPIADLSGSPTVGQLESKLNEIITKFTAAGLLSAI
jgi:hypothetical protein